MKCSVTNTGKYNYITAVTSSLKKLHLLQVRQFGHFNSLFTIYKAISSNKAEYLCDLCLLESCYENSGYQL